MIEDLTTTDLENCNKNLIEENTLKYTCKECNYATTNKGHIDDHVRSEHLPYDNEEVKFVCIICKHEFNEAEDYDSHVKTHESTTKSHDIQFSELENMVLCDILQHHADEMDKDDFNSKNCPPCNFTSEAELNLSAHSKESHTPVNDEHVQNVQADNVAEGKKVSGYKCNFCDFISSSLD